MSMHHHQIIDIKHVSLSYCARKNMPVILQLLKGHVSRTKEKERESTNWSYF